MAWGSFAGGRLTEIWNNSKYKAEVRWDYRQDPVANQTEVHVNLIRITSLTSYHTFYNAYAAAGIGISNVKTEQTVNANVGVGGSQDFYLVTQTKTFNHNSDGSISGDYTLYGYFKANINQFNTPEFGWTGKWIGDQIPQIDRTYGGATCNVTNVGLYGFTVNYTPTVQTSIIEYNIGNGWVNSGKNAVANQKVSFNISNLSPGKQYTVKVRHTRSYNGVTSAEQTLYQKTLTPTRPIAGSINVDSIRPFSARVFWSGFSFGQGATWGYYRYRINGGSWTNTGQNTSQTLSLNPETTYKVEVQLVDNFNQTSDIKSVTFTTLTDQAKVRIKVNGQTKIGRVYVMKGGKLVKSKKIYTKVNGSLKPNINP